ncbi:MAG TPA: hypothetical protein VFE58_07325 [Tepidisphaeraceae bacterium]|jgi:hypothetical protein|nr:hypothetical protein [Tepidisphaeraceae bacterium]
MSDDISNTIEVLTGRVRAKEDETNKLKKLINELCAEAGLQLRFPLIGESNGVSALRADQFYGLTLTAAIRGYLELRKAGNLGAATVKEIFTAVREGGYKFETKNEEIAQIGLRSALRKSSSIFHRLPNGQYGLLSWYPSAKPPVDGDDTASRKHGRKPKKTRARKINISTPAHEEYPAGNRSAVTNHEIRDVVMAQTGDFSGSDIEKAITEKYPSKSVKSTKISTVIFLLKQAQKVKEVTPRSGKTGAIFAKT